MARGTIDTAPSPAGNPLAPGFWRAEKVDEIVRAAEAFALSQASSEGQRQILETAFSSLRRKIGDGGLPPPFIHMPLLVHAAIAGEEERAVPLAVATTLAYAGIDLLDDLADGDLRPEWDGVPRAGISLGATVLATCLPHLALSSIGAPDAVTARLHKTLAGGLVNMAAGQQSDLAVAGRADFSRAEIEASVDGKSGEEVSLFCALAAILAEAPDGVVGSYASMGRAFAIACQLLSDFHDLFQADRSADLGNRTRSLVLAIHAGRLSPPERPGLLSLLEDARESESSRRLLHESLAASGAIRELAFIVEAHRQRALRQLDSAKPLEPAATELKALIGLGSFF